MVSKELGLGLLGLLPSMACTTPAYAQRTEVPRILTVVLPHTLTQQRCLAAAVSALETAGFVELVSTGSENDRSIYGKADGTNALFRCSQTNRVIIFALTTVNVGVDVRSVSQAVVQIFARSSGITIPQ
jgi:hypothetical protein